VHEQGTLQLADEPARQPFQAQIQETFDSDEDNACGRVTVPAGKRLVIETVTFRGFVHPDSGEYYRDVYVLTFLGGAGTFHYLNFSKIPEEPQWRASEAVRLYSDPESLVALCAQRWQTAARPATFSGSLSGYFVNVSA
jgi:hypothetical protein